MVRCMMERERVIVVMLVLGSDCCSCWMDHVACSMVWCGSDVVDFSNAGGEAIGWFGDVHGISVCQ